MLQHDTRYSFHRFGSIAVLLMSFCGGPFAVADVRLPSIIGSHMVMQQNSEVELWGWCEPAEEIKIKLGWEDGIHNARGTRWAKWSTKIMHPCRACSAGRACP